MLEDIISSQAEPETVVQAAVSLFSFDAPEEEDVEERGQESPVGGPEGPVAESYVCEIEAGTEADVEKEVDVVGGVVEVSVFGSESEEFTLSEFLRRKRLS